MPKLWLTYIDENGSDRRIAVTGEAFTIGRHSENDLCIPDPALSRDHVRIELEGDSFKIRDLGSSNGTEVNGLRLSDTAYLNDRDVITLGGAVTARVEIEKDAPVRPAAPAAPSHKVVSAGAAPAAAAPALAGSSIPFALLIAAPILGLIVVVFAIGLIYIFSGGNTSNTRAGDDIEYDEDPPTTPHTDRDNDGPPVTDRSPDTSPTVSSFPTPGNSSVPPPSPPPEGLGAIEENAASFLRRLAHNDPRAFITSAHAKRLESKIKQVAAAPSLAANINAAASGSSRITALARENSLKPQFVAVAGIWHLAGRSGDPAKSAEAMMPVLGKLSTHLGTEFGEDALLVIAAYRQGEAGEFLRMRNMLQSLSNQFPDSSRAIRTIWFLEENKKITAAEFDAALTFLAIGAITQNPQAFGVNAKALAL